MEPEINIELVNMYIKATGQLTSMYTTLLQPYINNLDGIELESLPNISTFLMAMVGVCYHLENHTVTMYQSSGIIVVTTLLNDVEILTLKFTNTTIEVAYPKTNGMILDMSSVDISSELSVTIVENIGTWDTDAETTYDIINYLNNVQYLIYPHGDFDPLTLLNKEKQSLAKYATHLDNVINLFEPCVEDDEEQSVSSQANSPKLLEENRLANESRANSFHQELSKEFLNEFKLLVDVVKKQTSSDIQLNDESKDILKLAYGEGSNEVVWTLRCVRGEETGVFFTRPTESDAMDIHYLDATSRDTLIQSFIKIIEDNPASIARDLPNINKTTLNKFITIILNIMISGASPQDIHLPTEEPEVDPDTQAAIKINKLAQENLVVINEVFESDRHVKILDTLGYKQHRIKNSLIGAQDINVDKANSFPELIAIAYASDLIRNSRSPDAATRTQFTRQYIHDLVSINWDADVLDTMNPQGLRNKPNWYTSYGFDKIIDSMTNHWNTLDPVNISSVKIDDIRIIPQSNSLPDIRKHLNQHKVLENIEPGVSKFHHLDVSGNKYTYRYIRMSAGNKNNGGDTLVIYIETTSERVRIIPIYTDNETNKVDSLNVFVSIRETEWPQILLYLDTIFRKTTI